MYHQIGVEISTEAREPSKHASEGNRITADDKGRDKGEGPGLGGSRVEGAEEGQVVTSLCAKSRLLPNYRCILYCVILPDPMLKARLLRNE